MSFPAEDEGSGRPKLSLQPRGSASDLPSPNAVKSSRPSPFGAARPREQVIAERLGKKETEVLKEQAKEEWKPQIVLTEAQREERKAMEAELAFARSELENEQDDAKAAILREEVTLKEMKLEELLTSFTKLAVHPTQAGGLRRSFDKKRDENPLHSPSMPYGGSFNENGFGNFRSRGRDVGIDRVPSYGDTWGGSRAGKGGGQSECYSCGEVGHFSRDCPRGGSYGGSFGRGRGGGRVNCYTCGQEGHFSRECPNGGAYGPRGGAYGGSPSYGGSYAGSQLGYEGTYGMGPGRYNGNGYDAGGYNNVRSGASYSSRRDYASQGDR